MTVVEVLTALVASACPRSCRSVLLMGASKELRGALLRVGLEVHEACSGRGASGAVVAVLEREVDGSFFRTARGVLARRGRLFVLCPERLTAEVLIGLPPHGLQAKRLLVPGPGDPRGWIVVVASAARPGGLAVQHWSSGEP